jgi:biopolymer transport protein ExbB
MPEMTLTQMMVNGWPVLSVLLCMSLASITVIVERLQYFWARRADPRLFVSIVFDMLARHGTARTLRFCHDCGKPIGAVAEAILQRRGDRAAMEQAARHALQRQIYAGESGVPILGTIASSAPFIGLLGTVLGIVRAFRDISIHMGGGPEVVAAGIAEALITTAGGLFVAIPASIGYNYFVRRVQKMTQGIELASYELIDRLLEGDPADPLSTAAARNRER